MMVWMFISGQQLISVDLSKHMITHMNRELTAKIDDAERLNLDQNSISKIENLSHLVKLQQVTPQNCCILRCFT